MGSRRRTLFYPIGWEQGIRPACRVQAAGLPGESRERRRKGDGMAAEKPKVSACSGGRPCRSHCCHGAPHAPHARAPARRAALARCGAESRHCYPPQSMNERRRAGRVCAGRAWRRQGDAVCQHRQGMLAPRPRMPRRGARACCPPAPAQPPAHPPPSARARARALWIRAGIRVVPPLGGRSAPSGAGHRLA